MRHLRSALLLALLSAASVALWLQQHREIWSERTYLVVAVWFLGGFFGALGSGWTVSLMARIGYPRLAHAFRSIAFVPAFVLAGGFVFMIQSRLQTGGFELRPERRLLSLLLQSADQIGLFIYSAPHYLLPWMAPVMAMAGYALLPRPRDRSKG